VKAAWVDRLDEAWWQIRYAVKRLWLIVKHRPFIICPFCKGKGGEVSGYYEPEWSECRACWHHWEDLEDHGLRWFAGRLPAWEYLRARASIWCGMWEVTRFRDLIRCKIGIHRWQRDDDIEPGLETCCVCYTARQDGRIINCDD
jgi:hypothetical protein